MRQDYQTNSLIGKGEDATFNILKHLTNLQYKSLREYPSSGIYRQVPLHWIISNEEYQLLSEAHKKGSIDLFIIYNQKRVAVRVQGKGHGEALKGLGKSRHDKVQEELIRKHCELVDIKWQECKQVFLERVTNKAIKEIIDSFKTAKVLIPVK